VPAKVEQRLASNLRADADVQALMNATPAQIDAWVDANVDSLAKVRRVLKLLLKLLVIVIRKDAK
jgi:hypothetical protein